MDSCGFLRLTGFLLIAKHNFSMFNKKLLALYLGTGFNDNRHHPTCLAPFGMEARLCQSPSKLNEKYVGTNSGVYKTHSKDTFLRTEVEALVINPLFRI